jgi:hypothetical protein
MLERGDAVGFLAQSAHCFSCINTCCARNVTCFEPYTLFLVSGQSQRLQCYLGLAMSYRLAIDASHGLGVLSSVRLLVC